MLIVWLIFCALGGGLAGLAAAHTVLEQGGRVLLLDKKDFMVSRT